jgi:hypothetical protein
MGNTTLTDPRSQRIQASHRGRHETTLLFRQRLDKIGGSDANDRSKLIGKDNLT